MQWIVETRLNCSAHCFRIVPNFARAYDNLGRVVGDFDVGIAGNGILSGFENDFGFWPFAFG
jgi:hypothetical protein